MLLNRHHKNRNPARGFTLVELLVTIAIIAVLAAIIMMMSRKMFDRAAVAGCTGNLRQIGIAFASHDSDYQRFPGRNDGQSWDRALIPYLGYQEDRSLAGNTHFDRSQWKELEGGIAETFCCPADKKPRDSNVYKRSYAIVPWTTNWSNGTQFRGWKNRPLNQGIPMSIIEDPVRAAVVVEWHSGNDDGVPNRLGSGGHAFHDRGGPDGPEDTVHSRNQIVLFADGHTEVLPFISNAEFVEKYWPGELGTLD